MSNDLRERGEICECCGATTDEGPCCSVHKGLLCHRCYRYTHHVEVCGCERCVRPLHDPSEVPSPCKRCCGVLADAL